MKLINKLCIAVCMIATTHHLCPESTWQRTKRITESARSNISDATRKAKQKFANLLSMSKEFYKNNPDFVVNSAIATGKVLAGAAGIIFSGADIQMALECALMQDPEKIAALIEAVALGATDENEAKSLINTDKITINDPQTREFFRCLKELKAMKRVQRDAEKTSKYSNKKKEKKTNEDS